MDSISFATSETSFLMYRVELKVFLLVGYTQINRLCS